MITLNNVHFAANDKEFVNSLFNSGGTASGYYRAYKNVINLLDHNKIKIGVISKHGVLAIASKPKGLKGKWWYSYSDIPLIGAYASLSVKDLDISKALQILKV